MDMNPIFTRQEFIFKRQEFIFMAQRTHFITKNRHLCNHFYKPSALHLKFNCDFSKKCVKHDF